MRKAHYIKERTKLEVKAKGLRDELAQLERRISALDVVWNEIFNANDTDTLDLIPLDGIPGLGESIEISGGTSPELNGTNGNLGAAIDGLLYQFSGEFGVKEMEASLKAHHPELTVNRTTVAGKLRKLVGEGKLRIVVQGQGRRPSSFQRADIMVVS